MNYSLKKAILQNTFAYVKSQAAAYKHKVATEVSVTAHICKDIWLCKMFTELGRWGTNRGEPSGSAHGSKSEHPESNWI